MLPEIVKTIHPDNVNLQIPDLKNTNSKEELVKSLDIFKKKKDELIYLQQRIQQSLIEIEKKEKEAQAKIAEIDNSPTPNSEFIETPKINTLGTGVLIVNKNQIVKSSDGSGEREHYKITLISKDNAEIEIGKDPIDTKKYGNIKQIVIRDGVKDIALEINETTQRIIKYMTANDFAAFRLELNKDVADCNHYYPNKYQRFDCQRFCYYTQHGKEGEYNAWPTRNVSTDAFKTEGALHQPGHFYKIRAYTANFGENSNYSMNDMSTHYYVCLANDVFVSKYGSSNILFTSYKQIIGAYFPAQYIKGIREEV